MRKIFSILLFVLLVAVLFFAGIVCMGVVQAVSKPSVPEFTAKYVNHPYERQPTTTTNPYTGETTITSPGGTYDNWTLSITVKNQKFTSTKDSSGNWTQLFYDVAYKGAFEDTWQILHGPSTSLSSYIPASKSSTTVIDLSDWRFWEVPNGGKIDVKVQALIGSQTEGMGAGGVPGGWYATYVFHGETGEWSSIQTVTINRDVVTPTQPPSASRDTPEASFGEENNQLDAELFDLDWMVVSVALFVGVVVLACVAVYEKRKTVRYTRDTQKQTTS